MTSRKHRVNEQIRAIMVHDLVAGRKTEQYRADYSIPLISSGRLAVRSACRSGFVARPGFTSVYLNAVQIGHQIWESKQFFSSVFVSIF